MRRKAATQRTARYASCLLLLLSTSCASKPQPIVSADTSCYSFKHISFDDAQRAAVTANYPLWKTAAEQVASHNTEYDKKCADPVAPSADKSAESPKKAGWFGW